MKPYNVPHKGLRHALSEVQTLAGKINYTDPFEVAELHELGEAVFTILTHHAAEENEVMLAELEERCPGCSQHDLEDHAEIHLIQSKLEKLLKYLYAQSKDGHDPTKDGEEFYLAFSEFHGRYLDHTAEEERVTQPLLWKHFTDEELAGHRAKIMSKNPPETLLIWFRFVFPALSHRERVALFNGFKKMASAPFYNEGLNVIRRSLSETEFEKLTRAAD